VQGVPIVRGGYLDATIAEPSSTDVAHGAWVAQDQQVLGFINTSLSGEVLGHLPTCTTAAAVWKELTAMFSSQSRAWMIQPRTRLATTRKGDQTTAVYYNKMKCFVDEMAAAGKPLEDEDFILYVLSRLDQDYNSFVENVTWRTSSCICVHHFTRDNHVYIEYHPYFFFG
jgi:hypothetical protein